jgi:hypothetical protein
MDCVLHTSNRCLPGVPSGASGSPEYTFSPTQVVMYKMKVNHAILKIVVEIYQQIRCCVVMYHEKNWTAQTRFIAGGIVLIPRTITKKGFSFATSSSVSETAQVKNE